MALILLLSFTTILFELLCLFLLFKVPSYLAFKVICVLFVVNCSLGYYDFRKFLKKINLESLHGAGGIVDIDSASAKEEYDSVSSTSEIKVDKGAIRRRKNVTRNTNIQPSAHQSSLKPEIQKQSFQNRFKIAKRSFRRAFYPIHLILHLILFIMCLDYVFHDYLFTDTSQLVISRVGAVGQDYAYLMVRVPYSNVRVQSWYRAIEESSGKVENDNWIEGPIHSIFPENDFTSAIRLSGLNSEQRYSVKFAIISSQSSHNLIIPPLDFKTFPPSSTQTSFTFAFGSCIKPYYPYISKFTSSSAIPGLNLLSSLKPDFTVYLGDFIYADAPFYFGNHINKYRWFYRYVMGFQETQNALKLPSYFTYDDHEVLNNWDRGVTGPYENAVRAFNDYLGGTNPVPYQPGHSYYNFTYGDSDFFMTDVRRYRSKSTIKDDSDKTMLGLRQKQDLKDWLLRTKENKGFKFLLTGVPMTLNWQCDYDTWSSYITERNEILDFIHENNIKRVLVLSADRHAIGIQLLPYSIPEFSISPINQFPAPFQFYSSDPPEKVLYHDRSSFVNVGLMRINTTGTRGAELIFELWDLDGLAWEWRWNGEGEGHVIKSRKKVARDAI